MSAQSKVRQQLSGVMFVLWGQKCLSTQLWRMGPKGRLVFMEWSDQCLQVEGGQQHARQEGEEATVLAGSWWRELLMLQVPNCQVGVRRPY